MTKFRVAFTIDAETLFRIMSQLLPVENLHVGELGPDGGTVGTDQRSVPKVTLQKMVKTNRAPRLKKGPNLKAGINSILLHHLSDGKPHYATEMKAALKRGGYSVNSVGSRLSELAHHKVVKSLGDGTWQLAVKRESAERHGITNGVSNTAE